MSQPKFQSDDTVRRGGSPELLTIKGWHEASGKYQVQRGRDAASIEWVPESELELVAKAPTLDGGPGFYPAKSIMGN